MNLSVLADAAALPAAAGGPPGALRAVPAAAAARGPAARRGGRLTEQQRWSIIAFESLGWPRGKTAERVECSVSAVERCVKRHRLYGTPASGARTGRPRITSPEEDINIAVHARVERFTSPVNARRVLDFGSSAGVSSRTIDRRMIEAGLPGRVARHKFDYTAGQLQARVAFARAHEHWDAERWSRVLFSDEKCFYGAGFCGRVWVRRPPGELEALDPENCVAKKAHPIKINVWGCFSAAGQGYVHVFKDNLNKELYLSILREHLKQVAARDFPGGGGHAITAWSFLQDNAPMHKAKVVSEWLHTSGIDVLHFPPYSPDLNPIENLWAIVQRDVSKEQTDTEDELGDAVLRAWNAVSKQTFISLAHSMPARCAAVLAAHGSHTKY
jgi:DDE superfamily endonuclease